jgi:hypothetical protein
MTVALISISVKFPTVCKEFRQIVDLYSDSSGLNAASVAPGTIIFYGIIPSNPLVCWGGTRQKQNHGQNVAVGGSALYHHVDGNHNTAIPPTAITRFETAQEVHRI